VNYVGNDVNKRERVATCSFIIDILPILDLQNKWTLLIKRPAAQPALNKIVIKRRILKKYIILIFRKFL
jgi:hypothetical protein